MDVGKFIPRITTFPRPLYFWIERSYCSCLCMGVFEAIIVTLFWDIFYGSMSPRFHRFLGRAECLHSSLSLRYRNGKVSLYSTVWKQSLLRTLRDWHTAFTSVNSLLGRWPTGAQ
ncbi:hypothetical protein TraAM80_04764 [Trypanosoma rangeli]|uniref:Uncharacterized protein n=1 Tax=Trypanosoma rangeli TaxID=5698 RepID=A0A422NI34_TRYRA|nr:uncharacterized protein TraAM80_04764 [Trypanosoma rangeli]RNF05044.1 hypothetical protein TraAM80_04764 [Trypanosoma rangeli]|eukprot:RNF05044.1 hypothetical protein TraAM80_04764 [Trypanosoma rangeli]